MHGVVDERGRALLRIELNHSSNSLDATIDPWVDTGFTGELMLPQSQIDSLNLANSGSVDAILADGSPVKLNTYHCEFEWFGKTEQIEVIANQGDHPLLGVGLLLGLDLRINYGFMQIDLTNSSET